MDEPVTTDAVEEPTPTRKRRLSPVTMFVIVLGLVGLGWRAYHELSKPDFTNYKVHFPSAAPWKEIPHSPGALWLYQDPQSKALIRGATQQMVFEFNPTPGQTSSKVANDMVDATHQNQKDWTAKRLNDVDGKDVTFCLVRRDHVGQCVITAVLSKGNTTLMVALSARDAAAKNVDEELPYFYGLLKRISLTPTIIP